MVILIFDVVFIFEVIITFEVMGRVGRGEVGWGRIGIVIIRLSQFNCSCNCLLELATGNRLKICA